jgi:hypothetical protein
VSEVNRPLAGEVAVFSETDPLLASPPPSRSTSGGSNCCDGSEKEDCSRESLLTSFHRENHGRLKDFPRNWTGFVSTFKGVPKLFTVFLTTTMQMALSTVHPRRNLGTLDKVVFVFRALRRFRAVRLQGRKVRSQCSRTDPALTVDTTVNEITVVNTATGVRSKVCKVPRPESERETAAVTSPAIAIPMEDTHQPPPYDTLFFGTAAPRETMTVPHSDHRVPVRTTEDHCGSVETTKDNRGLVEITKDHSERAETTEDHSRQIETTEDHSERAETTDNHSGWAETIEYHSRLLETAERASAKPMIQPDCDETEPLQDQAGQN